MKLSHGNLIKDFRWQVYKQLESIPTCTKNPEANTLNFLFGLDWLWRSLISVLIDELADSELQADYLERCLQSSPREGVVQRSETTLQKLWALIK